MTLCALSAVHAAPSVAIDLSKILHQVSPTLFGVSNVFFVVFCVTCVWKMNTLTSKIFFEEINYAGEGGLYGELSMYTKRGR